LNKSLKIFLLIFAIPFGTSSLHAQENEFGAWLGTCVYLGDLNPTVSFKNARWATGMFYRYNLNDRMAVRAQFNYGFLDAADKRIKRYPYLQARNLDFKSQLVELAATYEVNFFKYSLISSRGTKESKHWTPYVFMGLSLFYYKPYTKLNGEKYILESIGTEGQKSANNPSRNRGYDNYAIAIPYGIGVKIGLSQNWALNIEASSRITFSDYIDDVSNNYVEPDDVNYIIDGINVGPQLADKSNPKIGIPGKQRGTSKDKDRFMFVGVGITYTIQTTKCPKVL
jgi:hypothetical protein